MGEQIREGVAGEPLSDEAAALVRRLRLSPHPEGGYFREIHRSEDSVEPADGRGARSALTVIHFLLGRGQHSRWHRVASDEVWHHLAGQPLDLFWVEAAGAVRNARLTAGEEGVCVVPANCWQAARPIGDFALVACTVGPGFDFADFEMPSADSAAARTLEATPGLPAGLF